jgi:hypothetical protein
MRVVLATSDKEATNTAGTATASVANATATAKVQASQTALASALTATSAQASINATGTALVLPTATPTRRPVPTITAVDVTFKDCLDATNGGPSDGGYVILGNSPAQNFNSGQSTTFPKVKPGSLNFQLKWHGTRFPQHNYSGSITIPNNRSTFTVLVPCDRGTWH